MERRFAVREQLTGVVRAALGAEHRLVDVLRLRAAPRRVCTGSFSTMVRPSSPTSGTRPRLAEVLEVMRGQAGPGFGKVALVDGGGVATGRSCEQVVFERALVDLEEGAARDARLAAARDRLEGVVRELAAGVRPRSAYALVHGELGPDHVLVDGAGRPVLIDIEGLMYFDVEWEHAFLRLRFGTDYGRLSWDGLDERRLSFYTLAMRLSLVAGPLRLIEGDFPGREAMRGIAEHNLQQALTFIGG